MDSFIYSQDHKGINIMKHTVDVLMYLIYRFRKWIKLTKNSITYVNFIIDSYDVDYINWYFYGQNISNYRIHLSQYSMSQLLITITVKHIITNQFPPNYNNIQLRNNLNLKNALILPTSIKNETKNLHIITI